MPVGVHFGQAGLNDFFVPRIGGANEVIVGQTQGGGEGFPIFGQLIAIGLRVLALGLGGLLDFLAMLVEAGQEENFLPETAARGRQ